jgi:hypothetical protein
MTSMKMRSFSAFYGSATRLHGGEHGEHTTSRHAELEEAASKFDDFSGESASFVTLRQAREPGHAVSLGVDRGASPINKFPTCASNHT